jgi:thiol-disulfide isomerase/thioredoxin
MKHFIIWLLLLVLVHQSHAQKNTTGANRSITPLTIGQKMPDIALGPIDNNNTGKTKFSDFKGKLIILDTWNFHCSACFENFPHMAELQEEFKDKVQVFLVNISNDNQDLIDWGIKAFKRQLPTNIPRIRNGKALINYFPPAGEVGYHIWIDENGKYIGRGFGPHNTYAAKIRNYLAGKKVDFITDEGLANYREPEMRKPLFKFAGMYSGAAVEYSSMFTKFDPYLGPYFGMKDVGNVDSVNRTVRHSLINIMPLELINFAVKEEMANDKVLAGERILLYVKDTSNYTDDSHWYHQKVVDTLYKKRLSYEQITSTDMPAERRSLLMLNDLNNYFSGKLGATIKVEKRKMPCYILIRTSNSDKMVYKEGVESKEISVDGKKMKRLRGTLDDIFKLRIFPFYQETRILGVNDILLDETGFTGKVDIRVPDTYINNNFTLEDLRKSLLQYDLDIIKGEREINMLVIEEGDYKG